ncbi:SpoIIE family protein phosphatase [Streptomyces sp. NPDC093595]|uniref:SpoIIE family protein phosphatase n=1 Tax=Streptomyces sp. NPDC093595 TaxID=3366045 RepID=UPI00381B0EE6
MPDGPHSDPRPAESRTATDGRPGEARTPSGGGPSAPPRPAPGGPSAYAGLPPAAPAAPDGRVPQGRPLHEPGTGGPGGTGLAPAGRDELRAVLAQAAVSAVEAVGGYAGGVYLRTGTPGLLRLAVLGGLPGPLFRPWWRMHINRPFPIAEAYRSGRTVALADAEEAMRRFPQLMAGLPFPFGSLYTPVTHGGDRFGVLVVLRPATAGRRVETADLDRMAGIAHRLAGRLADLTARGASVAWDREPDCVQLPATGTPPVRVGHLEWDLGSGAVTVDEEVRAILGAGPGGPPREGVPAGQGRTPARSVPRTADELMALLSPEDASGLRVLAARAAESEQPVSRRIWVRGPDGRPWLLELTAHRPGRLSGRLVDPGTGPVIAAAADRLPRGMLSADRLGRVTFASRTAETLLGSPRTELVGTSLYEALPWLGHPAHEEHFRAALLSEEPVHFLAHIATGSWLSVSLYPGHDGLTIILAAEEQPVYTPGSVSAPGGGLAAGLGSPADRASVLYRPVALAIALTEAVTIRQVSAVVTEELLPAFGGRQLAIYLLEERHLRLAWETGFPQGFLDRFDGVALDARLPGVETLTSGRPIFFESMQRLADAYPGIPLDAHVGARAFLPLIASGRPIGSCILGFDQPRGFSPEERTVLTALAGLIAQALQRAQRYDSEAALARGLQDALMPHRLPRLRGVETVGRYLPGTQGMEVGGDWYDVIDTGRTIALVIGDVQGHGVSAAATMGQLRSAVRAFALSGHDPEEVMSGTNSLLIDLDPGQFASCCYADLDPATGVVRAVRAGHPQPLLRHPDGRTEVLDLAGGVVLGIDPDASFPVTELRLPPGAVLALFTDGLVERPGTDIDLGIERLRGTLAAVGRASLTDAADRLVHEATAATDRPDDIALLLAARPEPGGTPRTR